MFLSYGVATVGDSRDAGLEYQVKLLSLWVLDPAVNSICTKMHCHFQTKFSGEGVRPTPRPYLLSHPIPEKEFNGYECTSAAKILARRMVSGEIY